MLYTYKPGFTFFVKEARINILTFSFNMEEAGFMTYTAASHQGAIETL